MVETTDMSSNPDLKQKIIKPQAGPQEKFLSTPADIAIYGGSAGGGKTFALLMEPLRHISNANFGAVVFRRESTQITNEGGLWDTSEELYSQLGAEPRQTPHHEWTFVSGAKVSFRHLQHDKHVHGWQGSQIPLLCFDELTHFSEKQFWYMLSRNRSTCGVRPYVRASTNPDPDSWVAKLIDWWIGDDGYPIMERSGVIRWFTRISGEIIWGSTRDEVVGLLKLHGDEMEEGTEPKSITFIPARLEDNKILMEKDPGYKANLMALTKVERDRLYGGNWKVRETAGAVFDRSKMVVVDYAPELVRACRGWDLAATAGGGDWTAGVKIGLGSDGLYYVLHVSRFRVSPGEVKKSIRDHAEQDGRDVEVFIPQDPGQAGKAQREDFAANMAGFITNFRVPSGAKLVRAMPFASAVENDLVRIVRGLWNDAFIDEAHAFTGGGGLEVDDQIDAAGDAFVTLTSKRSVFDVF